jgi:hypothetical protein
VIRPRKQYCIAIEIMNVLDHTTQQFNSYISCDRYFSLWPGATRYWLLGPKQTFFANTYLVRRLNEKWPKISNTEYKKLKAKPLNKAVEVTSPSSNDILFKDCCKLIEELPIDHIKLLKKYLVAIHQLNKQDLQAWKELFPSIIDDLLCSTQQ